MVLPDWAFCLAAALLIAGCAQRPAGTGGIAARAEWPTIGAANGAGANVHSAAARSSNGIAAPSGIGFSHLPAGVVNVRAEVNGADMEAVTKTFDAAAGTGTIDGVPVGTGRTLALDGLNDAGTVIFEGVATSITVTANQTTDPVVVTMVQAAGATPPGGVLGFTAAPTGLDDEISLCWGNPPDLDFAGVRIMRREDGTYPTSPLDGTLVLDDAQVYECSGTPFTDTNVANGTTYRYSAFAYNSVPFYSAAAEQSTAPADTTPPGEVGSLSALGQSGQVRLLWLIPPDADFAGVMIRRKEVDPPTVSSGDLISTAAVTEHTDDTVSDGVEYFYTVFTFDDETPRNYSGGQSASATPGGAFSAGNGTANLVEDTTVDIALVASAGVLSWNVPATTASGSLLTGSPPNLTYTPNADLCCTDSFTFTAHNGSVPSNVATIDISIVAVNDPPTGASAIIVTNEDTASAGETPAVTDVDQANEGDTYTFSIGGGTAAANGTASVTGNQLVYTPNANYNGPDTFTFIATDSGGLSVTGTADVTVDPVNDAPVGNDQVVAATEDDTSVPARTTW